MNLISGVLKEDYSDYVLYFVESLSDELKQEIRSRLSAVCHGVDQAQSAAKIYSYKETAKEFVKRYKSDKNASEKRKKGMIGELLVHIILEIEGRFTTASPFFNMEERSFKKGYDVALFEEKTNELWIAEVKSGEIQKNQKDASAAATGLINTAKNDLKVRLNDYNTSLWLNALNAAKVTMSDSNNQNEAIKYVITSSTLLSGVNLPAERMFILDNRRGRSNLSHDSFKNLVGRVCRFNEIFNNDSGTLQRLEPQIYLVFGRYFARNANCENFLCNVAKAEKKYQDEVENVLLSQTKITEVNKEELRHASEFIENYENGAVENYKERYIDTTFGKACIMNGANEIDVFKYENEIQQQVSKYQHENLKINDSTKLLEIINELFIKYLPENGTDSLRRLSNKEARKFYAMMFEWRVENKSYSEMISLFFGYWHQLYRKNRNVMVYVGKWGDVKQEEWLEEAKPYIDSEVGMPEDLKAEIDNIYTKKLYEDESAPQYDEMYNKVIAFFSGESSVEEKPINEISNLTLLDQRTNRGYGNHIFPVKRNKILEKSGIESFIPLCTKNVFLKFYSKTVSQMYLWDKHDRQDYFDKMVQTIVDYLAEDIEDMKEEI